LVATVKSYAASYGGDCKPAVVSIGPVGAWTWTYAGPGGGGIDMQGTYAATNGECSGTITLTGRSTSLPSAPWTPGPSNASPPAEIVVSYRGDDTGAVCPSNCAPRFGVDMRRMSPEAR
jgi:hypothetical protein